MKCYQQQIYELRLKRHHETIISLSKDDSNKRVVEILLCPTTEEELQFANAYLDFLEDAIRININAAYDNIYGIDLEYSLAAEYYEKYKVRKYGFHGTSHSYVSKRAAELLGKDYSELKTIVCHLGNGASVSAVKNGKCVDTSMGLTPNAGVMMGSRCGDIDCSIVPYIMEQTGMSAKEMDNALNKQSGLLGISGLSSDSRDIEDGMKIGNQRCTLAQQMFTRRIIDHIAKYYVQLGGCDAIIFTAGVGENSIDTRRAVLEKLEVLGIKVDETANNVRGVETKITTDDSSVPAYIIPTNEELMIAKDTYSLVLQG